MHVTYQRFGGFSPQLMNRAPRYDAQLSEDDALKARSLLPADFFVLTSSGPPTRGVDAFRYEIGVDDGTGRQNQVTLSEMDVPPSLRPFLDWLQQKCGSGP